MTKVLVTGGTGFVGSHILDALVEVRNKSHEKLEIFATRRYHLSRRDKVEHLEQQVSWVDCDLTDPVATGHLIEKLKPDQIFHMASESFVSPSWDHPNRFMNVNYGATLNLLEAIKSFSPNCRILIPGSGEEYGEVQVEKLPIGVDTPLNPVNPYAVTKVAQDLIGYVYHKSYGLNVIRVRTFNHEGPRRERYFGISSYCFQLARMELGLQQNVLKVGDIKDKRNFIHVSDIVKAYLIAMRMCTPGELYLIGAEKPENIATFEEVISKLIGKIKIDKKIDIEQIKEFTRPTSVPYLIADSSKFSNLTGWEPSKSLDEILEDVLEYWRSRVRIHPSL